MEAKSTEMPDGWETGPQTMTSHPKLGSVHALTASKLFHSDGGFSFRVAVMAPSGEQLARAAWEVEDRMSGDREESVHIGRKELQRVLTDNARLQRQVGELQEAGTRQELKLRAHRKVPLYPEQAEFLDRKLRQAEETAREWYGK